MSLRGRLETFEVLLRCGYIHSWKNGLSISGVVQRDHLHIASELAVFGNVSASKLEHLVFQQH